MKRSILLFAFLLLAPCASHSSTSDDLRSRITVDGRVAEYDADEWILDETTDFPERRGDSRWGNDNDILGIALTWDLYNLYIAVPCVAFNSTLMLFVDTECGGVDGLEEVEPFRRNIHFSNTTPNFLLSAGPEAAKPTGAFIDCNRGLALLDPDQFEGRFLQDGPAGGALEVAVPWEVLGRYERSGGTVKIPVRGAELALLAVITGPPGSGAGDAAPDPVTQLENDPSRTAVCDRAVRVPLDADGDGMLDIGISPRAAAAVSPGATDAQIRELSLLLRIAQKVIAPEKGEMLDFLPLLEIESASPTVYLTARVFSSSGRLVDVVYEDAPRQMGGAAEPVWDRWDGRDFHGRMVPGGIYILTVSGGASRGVETETVKGAFSVIR